MAEHWIIAGTGIIADHDASFTEPLCVDSVVESQYSSLKRTSSLSSAEFIYDLYKFSRFFTLY